MTTEDKLREWETLTNTLRREPQSWQKLIDAGDSLAAELRAAQERDEWLRRQLDGAIESAEAVAYACGLATARAVVGYLKDARAALAASVPPGDGNG